MKYSSNVYYLQFLWCSSQLVYLLSHEIKLAFTDWKQHSSASSWNTACNNSVVGPLLYSIHFASVSNICLKCKTYQCYADNLQLYLLVASYEDLHKKILSLLRVAYLHRWAEIMDAMAWHSILTRLSSYNYNQNARHLYYLLLLTFE